MINIETIESLQDYVGKTIGISPWKSIDKKMIQTFAEATYDLQAIHLDASAASAAGFNAPIAHGYLLLSLLPYLAQQTYQVSGVKSKINYGLDKCRFVAPVTEDSQINAEFYLAAVEQVRNGVRLIMDVTVNIKDEPKPALVARTLALLTY